MTVAKHAWSLDEWLHHLEALHPKHMDFDLTRLQPVVARLGVGAFACPVITVAGTNGKGSVVALLSAAYQAAGLRVASTTSPHLLRVNERACINGQAISDQELVAVLQHVEHHRAEQALTYFEFLALAILSYFKQQMPDVVVLEVGLGGRLDVMNVVANDCAVITSIALDHVAQLGPTRHLIAKEKCGIFRAGALAVCGDLDPPAIIAKLANTMGCQLYQAPDTCSQLGHADGGWSWQMNNHRPLKMPATVLKRQNVATALTVLAVMAQGHGLRVAWPQLPKLLSSVVLQGRQQCMPLDAARQQTLLLDVAHNPHGAQYLHQSLERDVSKSRVHMVFAALQSKDVAVMLQVFAAYHATWYVAPTQHCASLLPINITTIISDMGFAACYSYDSVSEALKAACAAAGIGEKVVVWGSFHTVAEALLYLKERSSNHA